MGRNKTYTEYYSQTNETMEDDWYANECFRNRKPKDIFIPPVNLLDKFLYDAIMNTNIPLKLKKYLIDTFVDL